MAIVMTKDGQVRPLRPGDLREVAERDERIVALEQQCAVLAAQIDRQARVVDAAIEWKNYSLAESDNDELLEAIADYERETAGLAKGGQ